MAVCSILYQASTRLKQQDKMAEEIARVLPDPSKPLTSSSLSDGWSQVASCTPSRHFPTDMEPGSVWGDASPIWRSKFF
ncbi:Cytochrome P450 [Operophtera brumata]|uniref:Cytochrome P450 n=1 Tax=Operophtera brumata TaxID=104452 RepID=A0A0L7KRK2_OPEBR|nr:Cytochrome P450 [Operophtera brumata]